MALRVRRRRIAERRWRLQRHPWVDPYPQIPGTLPEKMLFAALRARGIYFIFQAGIEDLFNDQVPVLRPPSFRPDFVLPEYRVILDPFGEFHHSQPENVTRDQAKYVYYKAAGYGFYFPWASEITSGHGGALRVLAAIPELRGGPRFELRPLDAHWKRIQGYRLGRWLGSGAKAVALSNARRRRGTPRMLRRGKRTRRRSR